MILIVSNTQDLTADFVVRELRRRDSQFARLNTDEFPRHALGAARIADGVFSSSLKWTNRNRTLDWQSVSAVWYRRPITPVVDAAVKHEGARKFAADESYEFLRGLWYSTDCFWMSHPDAIRRAEHKIVQLKIAQQIGFRIPRTTFTNDPDEVLALREHCQGGLVAKPLYLGAIKDGDESMFAYTTKLRDEHVRDAEAIRIAPAIYQECIAKVADVRVTVVGDRVFASRIDTDQLPADIPDWRYVDVSGLRHSQHELPAVEVHKCRELVRRLGLSFGAIDYALLLDGGHVFLEINPNGQWAWLEQHNGSSIAGAIADALEAA